MVRPIMCRVASSPRCSIHGDGCHGCTRTLTVLSVAISAIDSSFQASTRTGSKVQVCPVTDHWPPSTHPRWCFSVQQQTALTRDVVYPHTPQSCVPVVSHYAQFCRVSFIFTIKQSMINSLRVLIYAWDVHFLDTHNNKNIYIYHFLWLSSYSSEVYQKIVKTIFLWWLHVSKFY